MEPTKQDWQQWYAHKSNKELAIEKEERQLDKLFDNPMEQIDSLVKQAKELKNV